MIINNIDHPNNGELTWTQSGSKSSRSLTGTLKPGQYTAPFTPVGSPPYIVEITASIGFTTKVRSPQTIVSYLNRGDGSATPLNTPDEIKRRQN